MKKLMVIISDRLSNIVEKGEVVENYYNPGNMFNEVHIVMTNDDYVNAEDIQKTVGTAELFLHNISTPKYQFIKTLAWRPTLLNKWAAKGVQLAQEINPDIIRCYGNRLSGYMSYYINKKLRIPYVLSMHEDPDSIVKAEKRLLRKIQYGLLEGIAVKALINAEIVIAVFDSTVNYLKRLGVSRYVVIYNSVNGNNIKVKNSYGMEGYFNIISSGRLIPSKKPENLIKAISLLDNVKLTIVGDGTEYAYLNNLTDILKCRDRIDFIKRMDNDILCQKLCEFDAFAIHCDVTGVPKTVIEAWLAGMPVIANKPKSGITKEYINGQNIILVENTVIGYKNAIEEIMKNESLREHYGQRAREIAVKYYEPKKNEEKVIDLLNTIISKKGNL